MLCLLCTSLDLENVHHNQSQMTNAYLIIVPNLTTYLKEPKSVFFITISSFRVQNRAWLKSVNILNASRNFK
jgi:hypothetical protein